MPAPESVPDGRPRVALIAHNIHDRGGMERACAELIRHAHEDVRFVAISCTLAPDLLPMVEDWIRVRVPLKPMPLRFTAFFVRASILARRIHPDLTHAVGAIIPNVIDISSIHFCHARARQALGAMAPPGSPPLRRMNTTLGRHLAISAERWCYRPARLRAFAPVSQGLASELASIYPGIEATVCPNGVDLQRFCPSSQTRQDLRSSEGVEPDQVIAVFLGGDWDRKGLGAALEGLAYARSMGALLQLWVVGSGDVDRFAQVANDLRVGEFIRFFGHRSDPERFLQAADIFVLPTLYETFSMVSYEAGACGLPIIATATSGIAELIGADEAGVVVRPKGIDVGKALARLAIDPGTRARMGHQARLRASQFTWERSSRAVLRLYQSLLASKRPSGR